MSRSRNLLYRFEYKDGVLKYNIKAPLHLFLEPLGFTAKVGLSINTILKFEYQKRGTHEKLILHVYQHNMRKEGKLIVKTIKLVFLRRDKTIPALIDGLIGVLQSSSKEQNVGLLPVKEEAKRIALEQLSSYNSMKSVSDPSKKEVPNQEFDISSDSKSAPKLRTIPVYKEPYTLTDYSA